MKIYLSHLKRDDTAHVNIRMNRVQFNSLREWMKTPDHFLAIQFPHGVRLNRRSIGGWAHLHTSNEHRAIEKLKTAVAIIRKWWREYSAMLEQERRVAARPADSVVRAYVDTGKIGGHFAVDNIQIKVKEQPRALHRTAVLHRPADTLKLQALARHFNRRG